MKYLYLILALVFSASVMGENKSVSLLDSSAIDRTVSPCNNFYQYACGNWIKNTTLPADMSHYDRGFNAGLPQKISAEIQAILENYAKGKYEPKVLYTKQLGNFYATCMNETQIEKVSQLEIIKQLKQINKIYTLADVPAAVAQLHLQQVNALFEFNAAADFLEPTMQIASIAQGGMRSANGSDSVGGLGLPSATYYTHTDPYSVTTLNKYKEYITKMFELAGDSQSVAIKNMNSVIVVETTLAKNMLSPEETHNPTNLYHLLSAAQLQDKSPNFNWSVYFKALNIKPPQKINVVEPDFLVTLNTVLKQYSVNDLKIYFKWQLLRKFAPDLSQKYVDLSFDFEQKYLYGYQTLAPRNKRCAQEISNYMGNAIGHAYVAEYFDPKAKEIALSMMKNIMKAFEADLQQADWLDESTRQAAISKLHLVKVNIGYPDKWQSFDGLVINRASFFDNVQRAAKFQKIVDLQKIGKKTDPNDWLEYPQVVDAAYIPTNNSIEVLAGILQPPYFSEKANIAQNYGGIGLVMGHELTHGFDTSGRKFDGYGAMKDWWTKETEQKYLRKVKCLEDQYSSYTVIPGVHVNGVLTITENIADNGGIKLAYQALQMTPGYSSTQASLGGFTGNQQYFLAMSQPFCTKATAAYYKEFT